MADSQYGGAEPVVVALAVVTDGERVVLTRRQKGEHLAGLWEFPGGKVGPRERADEAARRELAEERRVLLLVFLASLSGPAGPLRSGRDARWVPHAELSNHTMPEANRRILERLGRALDPSRPAGGI
jgi:8-oxo-dGTP diphosphatase